LREKLSDQNLGRRISILRTGMEERPTLIIVMVRGDGTEEEE